MRERERERERDAMFITFFKSNKLLLAIIGELKK